MAQVKSKIMIMYSYAFHFHNIQNKQLIPQRYPCPHIPVIFEDTFDAIRYSLKGLLFTQQHTSTCSFFYFCHTKIDEQDAKTKYLANLLSCFQPKCALGLLAYLGLLNPRYLCTQNLHSVLHFHVVINTILTQYEIQSKAITISIINRMKILIN